MEINENSVNGISMDSGTLFSWQLSLLRMLVNVRFLGLVLSFCKTTDEYEKNIIPTQKSNQRFLNSLVSDCHLYISYSNHKNSIGMIFINF